MDIGFFRAENDSTVGPGYIGENLGTALPYLTIISVAMVTGTVGNILVICTVFFNKKLRSMGNMFIVNLAIADLCVTAFVDPFSIVGLVNGEVWFEDKPVLCELIGSICLTACYCSMLNIGLIALNRYIHICHYHQYDRIYTRRNTIIMCVGVWIVSFLAEMPNFFGWGDHVYDEKTMSCVWDRTADVTYSIFFSVFGVMLPIVLIAICYGLIYRYVQSNKPIIKLLHAAELVGSKKDTDIEKQAIEMTRMVFICFVVFAICWVPYAFVVALDYNDTYPPTVHLYAILVAHLNSSLNNLVYAISNKTFRHAYYRLLGLQRCIPKHEEVDAGSKAGTAVYRPVSATAETKGI